MSSTIKQMTEQYSTKINYTVPTTAPIDPVLLVKNGESPTAIILAIAVLVSILVGSITGLVHVIMLSSQTKRSR